MAINGKEYNAEQLAAIPVPVPLPATDGHRLFRVQRNPNNRFNLNQQAWPRRPQDDDDNSGAKLSGSSVNNSNN